MVALSMARLNTCTMCRNDHSLSEWHCQVQPYGFNAFCVCVLCSSLSFFTLLLAGAHGGRCRPALFFRRAAGATFFLDRRPALRTIPLVGGLPCGGSYLREEGLHGFLSTALPPATGAGLPGRFPASPRLAPGRRPHARRR